MMSRLLKTVLTTLMTSCVSGWVECATVLREHQIVCQKLYRWSGGLIRYELLFEVISL